MSSKKATAKASTKVATHPTWIEMIKVGSTTVLLGVNQVGVSTLRLPIRYAFFPAVDR